MQISFYHSKRIKMHQALQVIISNSLIVVFGFLLVSGPDFVSPQAGTHTGTTLQHHHAPNHPLDSPIESDPIQVEAEDEKDLKDSLDDLWGKAIWGNEHEYGACGFQDEITFSQYARSVQNRSTVSFFVLYHAWKNSIC